MPLLEVGRVVRPHGLRGEVVVALLTNRLERLAAGSVLEAGSDLDPPQASRQLTVASSRPHKGRHLVCFEGVADLDAAEALRGVRLLAEAIEDPGALFVHELIGAEVREVSGRSHGRVVAVEANPASDLLVLEGGGLVPLVFVLEAGPDQVLVEVPDGLLE